MKIYKYENMLVCMYICSICTGKVCVRPKEWSVADVLTANQTAISLFSTLTKSDFLIVTNSFPNTEVAAAAAAKSLQSCPTL